MEIGTKLCLSFLLGLSIMWIIAKIIINENEYTVKLFTGLGLGYFKQKIGGVHIHSFIILFIKISIKEKF